MPGRFYLIGQSYLVIKAIQPQWFILLMGLIIVLVSLSNRGLAEALTWQRRAHTVPAAERKLAADKG